MKLTFDDIIDKHKGETCVISLHGPSLEPYIEKIQELQRDNKITRFSVNEWFDFFDEELRRDAADLLAPKPQNVSKIDRRFGSFSESADSHSAGLIRP